MKGHTHVDKRSKLLTCQTWVTEWNWFDYAQKHREQVPFLLVDRSPCTDPFFDPYASSEEERRPIISGLCRCIKNFRQGDTYIYITRVNYKVSHELGIPTENATATYLGIAALAVTKVYESHAEAASTFTSRRYVVAPTPTPYPPNIANEFDTRAAVWRESCIVSLKRGTRSVHYTPDCSTDDQWRQQVRFYHWRQKEKHLRVAECCLQHVYGREALQLYPERAPVFTSADWGGVRMNVNGITLQEACAAQLCQRIANGR
jgi:hypothetical protein